MKKNRSLPFFFSPFIALGVIFIANPVFGVTDILPDLLGCLFLWIGLTELSCVEGRIDTARNRLLGLAAVEGIKLLLTPSLNGSAVSSDMLAATAFFGVIECLLLILIINGLYEGLSYAVSRKGSGETLNVLEGAKVLAIVFAVLRTVFTVIPELAAIFELAAHSDISNAELYYTIAGLKNYFHLLNGVTVLAIGIWWAVSTCNIFKKLRGDNLFVAGLQEAYTSGYSGNIAKRVSTNLKLCCRMAVIALVFLFTLDLGNHSVLPNFVCTAVLLVALALLGAPLKKRLWKGYSVPVCIYGFVIQIAAYVYREIAVDLNIDFFSQLVIKDVIICGIIAAFECASFILIARMCEKQFMGYVIGLCGEKTAKLMYSVKIPVYAFAVIYFITYTLPLLRGYLVAPQIISLIVIGVIINANVNFVRASVENPEEETNLCADS